jgi:hypothetical protein
VAYTDLEKRRKAGREASARYKAARPERVKASAKAHREANKEKRDTKTKAWAAANPERRAEANKAWREANKEKVADGKKEWAAANPDKRLESCAKYRETHQADILAYHNGRGRALDRANRPQNYRKAYDPLCRPFPATYDPDVGEWVRCERTLLRAPDTSPEAHLAAALIVIDERLAEGEWAI